MFSFIFFLSLLCINYNTTISFCQAFFEIPKWSLTLANAIIFKIICKNIFRFIKIFYFLIKKSRKALSYLIFNLSFNCFSTSSAFSLKRFTSYSTLSSKKIFTKVPSPSTLIFLFWVILSNSSSNLTSSFASSLFVSMSYKVT